MSQSAPLLKIVVAGDGNVGKTSLIRQYCEGRFEQSRVATIGVDFQTKTVEIQGRIIKLSIWDMAGQIHFQSVRTGLYRGSRTAALVHDVTNPESLAHLQGWYEEVVAIVPNQRFLVVGNKIDLQPDYDTTAAKQFAAAIKAPYLTTSANTGVGVQKMFLGMAYLALKR
ncbi:MAG: GTP-binding protein [Anaerolineaceae bacterium]|nr:GTP-binding protein [Anaerolineaceae bacterium]